MPTLDRPRILVVDDEPDFRTSLTDILESRGYECVTAGTIRQAAELVRAHLPNLCLVDLKLPDGSGLDLLTKIRETSPGSETIILTGYASLPTAVRAMSLGAFGYLEKPYQVDRLFLTLEKALERQRLVQTVERSETAYSQLLNATGAAIFSLTPITWRISNVNPAFTRLLGFTPEEAEKMSLDQLLPDSDRAPVMKMLNELSKSRPELTRSLTFEAPLRPRNGTPGWFSISATRMPRVARDQEPNHGPNAQHPLLEFDLLLVCNDISVSRAALVELERTKNFTEGVFAALPCGVVIVDSDFRIIDSNPAYAAPLGLKRPDIRGRRCHEVFNRYTSPCSMLGELCPITAARTTGTFGRVYREHALPDGRTRNLEYTANPLLDDHGSISAFVVVANDLTDLREAEERLHQAKLQLETLNSELRRRHEELKENSCRLEQTNIELVKLSNAKSDFVATVSHELRTPLTAISEGVALVEDGSLGPLNADQQTFLRLAGQNTKRLADLINDLLDLSKIEAGRMELSPRRLDLNRIIKEVVATYSPGAREKGLTLTAEISPALEPALADESSVRRILTNLIGNAVKFTPSGGTITVRDGNGRHPGSTPDAQRPAPDTPVVTLTVEDTGIGIPKDQQHRLFGKFEQINQPGDVRPRGTGLGLALTRQLVEMNHGRIWLDSDEGMGARLIFTLPVYDELSGFAASFRHFAKAASGRNNGTPAIYYFRAHDHVTAHEGATAGGTCQTSNAPCTAILPHLSELLESLFPRPHTVCVVGADCSVVVLAPRKLPGDKLRTILQSLKGASFFIGEREAAVSLHYAELDYPPELLDSQSGADHNRTERSQTPGVRGLNDLARATEPRDSRDLSPLQAVAATGYRGLSEMAKPLLKEV